MDSAALIQATLTLFAIVDPVGTIPIFLMATRDLPTPKAQRAGAIAALTVWTVLAAAALVGEHALRFFDIRIESFSVAGGLLLLMLSLSMLQAHVSPMKQTPDEALETEEREAVGAVPLGVPLLAGPGAITHVIVTASGHHGEALHLASLLVPITLVSLSVWACFHAAPFIAHRLGRTGIHIITRLMGLVVAALSVEMIARGLVRLFPGWGA